MEHNILLLAEENLSHLATLNLQMYPQVLVTISSQDGSVSIAAARQLLALQLQHKLNIRLMVSSSAKPDIFWAGVLGKLAASSADKSITLLSGNKELMSLVELCTEQGQSVQLLQIHTSAGDNVVGESEKPLADTAATPSGKEEKSAPSVAGMIAEKEGRQRKNEQIINALMKKASALPYQVSEGKPVSTFIKEQEVSADHQIQLA
jgi:hypothetical protein